MTNSLPMNTRKCFTGSIKSDIVISDRVAQIESRLRGAHMESDSYPNSSNPNRASVPEIYKAISNLASIQQISVIFYCLSLHSSDKQSSYYSVVHCKPVKRV